MIELAAPRPLNRGESIQVQIKTGPLPRGARLTLMTERARFSAPSPRLVRRESGMGAPPPCRFRGQQ
jgi:hypothetical protein